MLDLIFEWLDYVINGIDLGTRQDQRRVWSWLRMKADIAREKRQRKKNK